jgi:nicotinate-nucleotide adenylyltransferase
MLETALADEPGCEVSAIEMEPGGPRFTVDTLGRLSGERPGSALLFVMGMDSLHELAGWREPVRILQEFGVVAVDRPGAEPPRLDPGWESHCLLVRGNPFAISSTQVRRRVAAGLSIRHLVPDRVADYIRDQGLYRLPDGAADAG